MYCVMVLIPIIHHLLFAFFEKIDYIATMYRITTYFLLFFVLFTHSAIAMDVHAAVCSQESELIADVSSDPLASLTVDLEDSWQKNCSDLGGHCSHSSAHLSGIVSSISISAQTIPPVLNAALKTIPFIHNSTPPLRPPKA